MAGSWTCSADPLNEFHSSAIRALAPTERPGTRAHVALIGSFLLLSFVLWPIYLFPAGYPQPMSFGFICAIGLLGLLEPEAIARQLRQQEVLLIAAFVGYTFLVNSLVAITGQDPEPLLYSLYYTQALLACLVVVFVFRNWAQAPMALHGAIVLALLIQAVTFLVIGITEGERAMLLFGNPNQLGFFALLALGYVLHLHTMAASSRLSTVIGAGIAIALVLLSLSKAAIVASIVMLLLFVCLGPFKGTILRRGRPFLILAMPALLGLLIFLYRDEIAFANVVIDRLSAIGLSEDDSLAGRGYSRIAIWPQYLFLGAGEGLVDRWGTKTEIHSMLGTLLFSYGLPGIVIIASLFAVIWRRNRRGMLIYGLPILLYSLTHQPMRQPMMWILLLLIAHGAMSRPRLRSR